MINKIYPLLLFAAGLVWFISGIAITYGYKPSKFSTVIAFLATGVMVFGWAYEAWKEQS